MGHIAGKERAGELGGIVSPWPPSCWALRGSGHVPPPKARASVGTWLSLGSSNFSPFALSDLAGNCTSLLPAQDASPVKLLSVTSLNFTSVSCQN